MASLPFLEGDHAPENHIGDDSVPTVVLDYHTERLRQEAEMVLLWEPEMAALFRTTILAPGIRTFEDAVARTLCHRLLLATASPLSKSGSSCGIAPADLYELTMKCMRSKLLEHGSTMADAVRSDAMAVLERDPATDTLLEVVLYAKGFAALVAHRVAHRLWHMRRKYAALFIQSQTSAVFGLDIHPLARIGKGVMFDHGTAVVVGETATIGEGCTILHSVTLGGTGKDHGDRHPKVGNHVMIGAGSLLLGDIHVGDYAKIGAGSVLLRSIPAHATAVGVPAKIIGRADSAVDANMGRASVSRGHSSSIVTTHTSSTASVSDESSVGSATTLDEIPVPAGVGAATTIKNNHCNPEDSENADTVETPDLGSFHKLAGVNIDDAFCPYPEYYMIARNAPKGTVSIVTLRKALSPLGVSTGLIGACFFEMDHHGKGYLTAIDFERVGAECISRVCEIPVEEAAKLVQSTIAASA